MRNRRDESKIRQTAVKFDDESGKRMIRNSITRRPSKEIMKKEMERLRKSFNMGEEQASNLKSCLLVKQDRGQLETVKWEESDKLVRELRYSKVRASLLDDLFWSDSELADFRYEAFMEECGLDPAEFD